LQCPQLKEEHHVNRDDTLHPTFSTASHKHFEQIIVYPCLVGVVGVLCGGILWVFWGGSPMRVGILGVIADAGQRMADGLVRSPNGHTLFRNIFYIDIHLLILNIK
jgi:hypothetical protein